MKHAELVLCDDYLEADEIYAAIAQAIAAERTLLAAQGADGVARPRTLGWSDKPDGLLVESDQARYFIGWEDREGMTRLASLIRAEFVAGVAGSC